MAGEREDVLRALAQGREVDREDVQPVVEVAPERSPAHQVLEVPVGPGDDPYVDASRPIRANGGDGTFLQHAQ